MTYSVVSQPSGPLQSCAALLESGYAARPDSLSIPKNPIVSAPLSSWTYNVVPTGSLSHVSKGIILFTEHADLLDALRCHW